MYREQASRQEKSLKALWVTAFAVIIGLGLFIGIASAQCNNDDEFTSEFRLQDCQFKTVGANPFFILQPGYQLILQDDDGKERVVITVLSDKEAIHLDGQTIMTRVVEERESEDGKVIEISRNFFAICEKTNDVFYFGEDVSVCEGGFANDSDFECADGTIPENPGQWRAGETPEDGEEPAQPGVIMPGGFLLGSKYFQEVAFPVAADRAENVEMGLEFTANGFDFEGCVKVIDTNSVEGGDSCKKGDTKVYCPGVGLVQDEDLKLVPE